MFSVSAYATNADCGFQQRVVFRPACTTP